MTKFKFKEITTKHVNSADQWTVGFFAGASFAVAVAVGLT